MRGGVLGPSLSHRFLHAPQLDGRTARVESREIPAKTGMSDRDPRLHLALTCLFESFSNPSNLRIRVVLMITLAATDEELQKP